MNAQSASLLSVFDGWAGYNTSIVHAIGHIVLAPLAEPDTSLRRGDSAG